MGKNLISYNTEKQWFKRFQQGYLENDHHPRQPSETDSEILKQLREVYPRLTISEQLECCHSGG